MVSSIEKLIKRCGPYLLVKADPEATVSLQKESPRFAGELVVAMDIGKTVEAVKSRITAGQVEFNVTDLSRISGQHYASVQRWCDKKFIVPSRLNGRERLFTLESAFVAGIFGALLRQRQTNQILKAVSDLMRN